MLRRRPSYPHWLARLLGPGEPEMTCDECFAALDRYVELELAGTDAEGSFPGMRAHLDGCRACREEHELLFAYAKRTGGRSSWL
jgi:hypothetical protein